MKKYFVIAIVFLLSLTACIKEIEFKSKDIKPRLVVNSKIQPDSIFLVNVSHSLNVLDQASINFISNAVVKLYDGNGNFIEDLIHQSEGDYSSPSLLQPQVGNSYRIVVSSGTYESVESSTLIPAAVASTISDTATVSINNGEAFKFKIRFTDPTTAGNYYMIKVYQFYYNYIYDGMGNIIDSTAELNPTWISSSSINVEDAGDINTTKRALFTRDHLYNGQQAEIEVYIPTYWGGSIGNTSYILEFSSCTEEYFLYTQSLLKYYETEYDPFAQPVQIFSNINKGIGIFAGFNPDLKVIR